MAGRRRGATPAVGLVLGALAGATVLGGCSGGGGSGRPAVTTTTRGSGTPTTAGDVLAQLAQLRADVDAVDAASSGHPGTAGAPPPCTRLQTDLAGDRDQMRQAVEADPDGERAVTAALDSVASVADHCRAPGQPGVHETVALARQRLQAARDALSQRMPA